MENAIEKRNERKVVASDIREILKLYRIYVIVLNAWLDFIS